MPAALPARGTTPALASHHPDSGLQPYRQVELMLRRSNCSRSGSDGWASLDPVDTGIIERLYKKQIREREEALMLAVLDNAIECFQKYVFAKREREKRRFQEAEDWILEKNSDWFFSFENICETLQLYPDYIRQGLLGWKEAKLKSHSVQEQSGGHGKKAPLRGVAKTGT